MQIPDTRIHCDRRVVTAVIGVALAMSFARPVRAQGAPQAGVRSVSMNEALGQSRSVAPDALLAAARGRTAFTEIDVARMYLNPSITVGSSLSAPFYTAFVVSLPVFGQRAAAVNVAESTLAEAERDIDVTRVDVRLATALAWVDLWLAQREAESARETETRRARLQTATQERFDTGTAPRLDVVRAHAEAARAHADSVAAEQLVRGAMARLSIWMGAPASAGSGFAAVGDPASIESLPEMATLFERLPQHPVFVRAQMHQRAGHATVLLEQRRRWPMLGLEVGGNFGVWPGSCSVMATSSTCWSGNPSNVLQDLHAALTVEVPLLHVHGPLIARARAAESQATLEADVALTRLRTELAGAHAAFQAAQVRAEVLARDVLPAATEAAELALEAYRSGRLDIAGVLSAEQALTDARIAVQRAIADRTRALASLEHAVGGPL